MADRKIIAIAMLSATSGLMYRKASNIKRNKIPMNVIIIDRIQARSVMVHEAKYDFG